MQGESGVHLIGMVFYWNTQQPLSSMWILLSSRYLSIIMSISSVEMVLSVLRMAFMISFACMFSNVTILLPLRRDFTRMHSPKRMLTVTLFFVGEMADAKTVDEFGFLLHDGGEHPVEEPALTCIIEGFECLSGRQCPRCNHMRAHRAFSLGRSNPANHRRITSRATRGVRNPC